MTPAPLAKPLRTQLENTVKSARDIAETAARAALQQLAVGDGRAPDYLNDAQRALRRRLRAHGRSLGDAKRSDDDTQELRRLAWEVAYEHWHRMLFARFLAENGLLLWEPGAAVSLQDCREMVDNHPDMAMGARSEWELAGKLAARMLPQVFKPQHPVFELVFAPEHQRELERLLAALPPEVFQASDSLGWVYQFWQARRKDEVNASEVKIGADELPAVTQLFTEPYMVDFLLHNSLGAWWLTRHPDTPCPVPLTYLRTLEDGTPAAGKFEGWPDTLADFKLLDPCCGSGHFLVAAFLMLVPMRMASEHLSAREAVDAVLRDNLHGLELDPRCVEIAVFALALAAWRFPDEAGQAMGVRADMPAPNIACCGLKVAARAADWMALVPDEVPNAAYLRQELRLLHDSFSQAPLLGSLLDPARSLKNDLATTSFDTLRALLERALSTERPATLRGEGNEVQYEAWDHALTARGLLDAARVLSERYHLVVTNVPFLTAIKYSVGLKDYIEQNYRNGKANLATAMALRIFSLTSNGGVAAYVAPQSWMFLKGYSDFRAVLLREYQVHAIARLGERGFQSAQANGEQVSLNIVENRRPTLERFAAFDASAAGEPEGKAHSLRRDDVIMLDLSEQYSRAQHVISFDEHASLPVLGTYATALRGCGTGDSPRFVRQFWEPNEFGENWEYHHTTASGRTPFGGMSEVIFWQKECGQLAELAESVRHLNHAAQNWRRGKPNWGKRGALVSQMGDFPTSFYLGAIYDPNCCAIVPNKPSDVLALWLFCASPEFATSVKALNQNRKVEVRTFLGTSNNPRFSVNPGAQ